MAPRGTTGESWERLNVMQMSSDIIWATTRRELVVLILMLAETEAQGYLLEIASSTDTEP